MMRARSLTSIVLALATCGTSPTAPAPQGGSTVTFTASGLSPREVSVNRLSRVTFVNDDSLPHQPASDPHPAHTLCTVFNLPVLPPGGRVDTADLTEARDCHYHDEANPQDQRFTGRVLIGLQ